MIAAARNSLAGIVLAVVLAACADGPADSLLVTRYSDLAANRFAPFERRVDDAATVAALEEAVRALPPYVEGRYCPNDAGLRYRLRFSRAGSPVQDGRLEAGGCRALRLSDGTVRETDDRFWGRLAGALGFPTRGHDLFVQPLAR